MNSRNLGAALFVAAVSAAAAVGVGGCAGPGGDSDASRPYLMFYDVADLFERSRDLEPPDLGVVIPDSRLRRRSRRDKAITAAIAERVARLAEAIDQRYLPHIDEQSSVGADGTRLAVRAPTAVHQEIQTLLDELRQRPVVLVRTEVSFVPIDAKLLQQLAPSESAELETALRDALLQISTDSTYVSKLSGNLDDLVRRTRTREDLDDRYQISDIRAFPNQRTHSLSISQTSIIADFRVVDNGDKKKLEPVVGYLNTGVVVEVEPAIGDDPEEIDLNLRVHILEEVETHEFKASELSRFKGIEGAESSFMEVPEVSTFELGGSLTVPTGEWIVAGAFPSAHHRRRALEQDRDMNEQTLVVVRATIVKGSAATVKSRSS